MKGIKRQGLDKPPKQALPLTNEMLAKMRTLLDKRPNVVQWRTIWRAHVEFGLMLRFDDVKRLKVKNVSFETNSEGPFIRLKLEGGKAIMSATKAPERQLVPTGKPGCLYDLTVR